MRVVVGIHGVDLAFAPIVGHQVVGVIGYPLVHLHEVQVHGVAAGAVGRELEENGHAVPDSEGAKHEDAFSPAVDHLGLGRKGGAVVGGNPDP